MSDHELLQMAAKAAGLRGVAVENFEGPAEFRVIPGDGSFSSWNPLQDDGDALRLAVKLRILVGPNSASRELTVFAQARERAGIAQYEACGDDPAAATRRAIVRAAAAIGATQEESGRG